MAAQARLGTRTTIVAPGRVSSTRTVERALALLSEVCPARPVTLTECARQTALPASTALRLLRTLETRRLRQPRRRGGSFRAGPRMIQLGATAIGRNELVRLAAPGAGPDRRGRPASRRTSRCAGSTTRPSTSRQVEGTHAVRHTSWIGRAVPMDGLAVGRVLRGEIPGEGYVAGRDRLEPDVTAIVAPVRYPGGIAGALSVLGPDLPHRRARPCTTTAGSWPPRPPRSATPPAAPTPRRPQETRR